MKLTLPASVVFDSVLLSSCGGDTTPTVVAPALVSGTVNLGLDVLGLTNNVHTNADAARRTLKVRASCSMQPQSLIQQALTSGRTTLRAQAINVNDAVLASALIGAALTYTLPTLAPLTTTLQVTPSQWPEELGVTCTRTTDWVSDPAARTGWAYFELAAGGTVNHSDELIAGQVHLSETAFLSTTKALLYGDRAATYQAQGSCTTTLEGQIVTVQIDINQTLRSGWNIVTSSLSATPDGQGSIVSRANLDSTMDLYSLE